MGATLPTDALYIYVERLQRQRLVMKQYLVLRVEIEDWHGVMDAAADIRELDARIEMLEHAMKS